MKSKKVVLNRELVELKHNVLLERIEKVKNKLKNISIVANCENESNSLEIIKQQYGKMYKAVLQSEEYDKYQEVENTIIQEIAKIESKVDKYIYSVSKRFDGILGEWFNEIRETENYKNFNNLDKELEKVKQLKEVFEYCKNYFSRAQENQIHTKISTFKFELLIRRQIEQIVYRNGVASSRRNSSKLNQYDNQREAECFCTLLENMLVNIRDDEVLKNMQ